MAGGLSFGLGACAFGRIPAPSPWRAGVALPFAVQEIYPAAAGGRIHLAGGLYAENGQIAGVTDAHVSWAPGDFEWREEPPLPAARHHPNLVGVGDTLFALGGFATREGRADWTMADQTWRLEDGEWQARRPAPELHGETVCAALGDNIHVVGGRGPTGDANLNWTDHGDTNRHLIYDPTSDQWSSAAPALVRRNSAAGAVLNGALHVVGGRQVGGGNLTNHEVWAPEEDRWRTAAPMPKGQGGLAAANIGGRLYAFGGEFFADGGGVYRDVWAYDPAKDEWAAAAPMVTPRHGLGAVSLSGSIYVIGGAAKVGGNDTSAVVEVFTPE